MGNHESRQAPDWAAVRRQFPALANRIFLDAACVSLLPAQAGAAVSEFVRRLAEPDLLDATAHHVWMDAQLEQAVASVAEMLQVGSERIALVESTTHGLNIAAQAINWSVGDEVLLCDLEFLQVAIPFVQLALQSSVQVKFIHHRDGIVDADMFRSAITPRTRAVIVSSTQWTNGYRIDLPAVVDAARSVRAWVIVDAIQQAGAIPMQTDGVDFLIAGGHKWLNSPLGLGFLCMSARVLSELEPRSWGYLALNPPAGGWGNYFTTPDITPDRSYEFVRTAKRFEIGGTSNYAGAVALANSVKLLNQVGPEIAAERIWTLGDRLINGLRRLPVRLETPIERRHRAGIIAFTLGDRERDRAVIDCLRGQRISVAQRYTSGTGGVRVSVHYFNNEHDIDHLLAALAAFLGGTHS
jgi:selenocysteine lyase/cysteine desulfurase